MLKINSLQLTISHRHSEHTDVDSGRVPQVQAASVQFRLRCHGPQTRVPIPDHARNQEKNRKHRQVF